ncbi:PTS lactose/cellobiose transporter subunit IIA [Jeotgalibaca sp. MA1X17-3]|uniref:PTS lactose/cellobiose transporter subunit IIA n=1 Tax=Jeotgalibaca sp. MA1X17-3 TaxID=2908211 RepID=UPI001F2E40E0|nr:PTS lactose/cellobiose transporter subunit IIA [Jeotgalibaca sp. MA1X17-3]UJF15973.1 PTS lactose/cellobiose transporter subunit IIA [Jeotgalibaca sp. MA1X17-3]
MVNTEVIMNLIINAGGAKSSAMEAIYAAKKSDFDTATEKFKLANEQISKAHNAQTSLISAEANGDHTEINLIMIHAQDHLMTAIAFIDLAKELVDFYKLTLEKGKDMYEKT